MTAAAEVRAINKTKIEALTKQIEEALLNMFPSLDGKIEDGVEDWACDVINCSNHGEVDATLERITSIERSRTNKIKIQLINKRLSELRGEVTELESEIDKLEIGNS